MLLTKEESRRLLRLAIDIQADAGFITSSLLVGGGLPQELAAKAQRAFDGAEELRDVFGGIAETTGNEPLTMEKS